MRSLATYIEGEMAQRKSPEYLAFQKNYVILHNLRHGIESIARDAFAAKLICTELRDKCSNKSVDEMKRTTAFLEALEGKLLCVPETLYEFMDMLNNTNSFGYIAENLCTTLNQLKPKTSPSTAAAAAAAAVVPPKKHSVIADCRAASNTLTNDFRSLNISGSDVLPFDDRQVVGISVTPPPTPAQRINR